MSVQQLYQNKFNCTVGNEPHKLSATHDFSEIHKTPSLQKSLASIQPEGRESEPETSTSETKEQSTAETAGAAKPTSSDEGADESARSDGGATEPISLDECTTEPASLDKGDA